MIIILLCKTVLCNKYLYKVIW